MTKIYRFPECKLAAKAPLSTQAIFVLGEVHELIEAENNDCFDYERIVEEAWDVIHSVEGVLRKFDKRLVEEMRDRVERKNRERGYYDD